MVSAWYISADMQLFVVSPVFTILLYHVQYVGLAAVALTMIAATATVGNVSAANTGPLYIIAHKLSISYLDDMFSHFTGSIYSYLTGILLG